MPKRSDPRKNVPAHPREKIEIHRVTLHGDENLDHCWVPFVGDKPLEFENPCTSVDAAKDATAAHFGVSRGLLRFDIRS